MYYRLKKEVVIIETITSLDYSEYTAFNTYL